jgi:hypothetical protein
MTINAKIIASKTVNISVNVDNSHRYEFTVEIPFRVDNDRRAISLTGTNSAGKKFKLGRLGIATMQLLLELGHAVAWETREEEGHCWTLRSPSRSNKWRSEPPTLPDMSATLQDSSPRAK